MMVRTLMECMEGSVESPGGGGGGGGYLTESRVGRCGPAAQTLTLFKTQISDFPTLFKTECQFLIPCLRHLL